MKDPKGTSRVITQRSVPTEPDRPLYPLAMELGDLKAMCEKLLHRVQQLERREKDLNSANRSIGRELNALKRSTAPLDSSASQGQKKTSSASTPKSSLPKPRISPSGTMDDFHSAMDELSALPDRH